MKQLKLTVKLSKTRGIMGIQILAKHETGMSESKVVIKSI